MSVSQDFAYVRAEEEPILPAPRRSTGTLAWMRANLFSTPANAALTLVGLALLVWVIPPILRWAGIRRGMDRHEQGRLPDLAEPPAGPSSRRGSGRFMYGRYPVDERWRIDLAAILLIIGLIPMAIPRVPYKRENALYLLFSCRVAGIILLTGGNFDLTLGFFAAIVVLACLATGLPRFRGRPRADAGRTRSAGALSRRWSPSSPD
jgi:general L-amino acid transport system permease protein